jgi:hypothetical protein
MPHSRDGFYEWKGEDGKQPSVHLSDELPHGITLTLTHNKTAATIAPTKPRRIFASSSTLLMSSPQNFLDYQGIPTLIFSSGQAWWSR